MPVFSEDVSLVFGGAAGQGVQTIANALIPSLKKSGLHVFACHEYMSRIRGGCNTVEIRISGSRKNAFLRRIDLLFALDASVFPHVRNRIRSNTIVFAEKTDGILHDHPACIEAPFESLARQAGSASSANTVCTGTVLGLLGIGTDAYTWQLRNEFERKGEKIVETNIRAAALGYGFGARTAAEREIGFSIERDPSPPRELLLDGTTAIGIGTIAAGCNFVTSYPMSPGTGLLTFLAGKAKEFGIVVDQAEDEIAAVNAAIGAAYAGARPVVTTSGGGFDLMQEGLSLAGMTETPLVIHVGQRPGPATGMPTRTEQGDLDLLLHAGHGEFVRAILAPGTLEEAVRSALLAFDLAYRFQIPVFLLTDQFFLDAVSTIPAGMIPQPGIERHIVETAESYRRYALTPDGISPRGVPDFGRGVVRVDSDEHDEEGQITENFDVRRLMVEKRLKRIAALRHEALMPTISGNAAHAETLLISWGSNRGVMDEALETAGNRRCGSMHFSQVYPINPEAGKLLEGKRIVVLENNATGQFAGLLRRETGLSASKSILKASGEPFSVEEIADEIRTL